MLNPKNAKNCPFPLVFGGKKKNKWHHQLCDCAWVDVEIHDVTHWMIVPARGPRHQSAGVCSHHVLGDLHCVELTPGLVEDDPEDDAGMVPSLLHPEPILPGEVVPVLPGDLRTWVMQSGDTPGQRLLSCY